MDAGSTSALPVVRAGVGPAVRLLLDLDDRPRYRAEFLTELHELDRWAGSATRAGALFRTFALRAAPGCTPSSVEEDVMAITTTRSGDRRHRFLRKHRWVTRSTADGSRDQTCSRCGRDQSEWPGGPGAMGAIGGV